MADKKSANHDGRKNEQRVKRRAKIEYQKCYICGARKKEQDMKTFYVCNDCHSKSKTNPNFGRKSMELFDVSHKNKKDS